jgi:predicted RNA-binding protein with RPS1 domain
MYKSNHRYHIIYETKNTINDKIYVGKHSTYDLDDGYMGSGILLRPAFEKYGKEYFIRTILHFCSTEQAALQLESEIVDSDFVARADTYNLTLGGRGAKQHSTSSETRAKISKGNKGKVHSIEHRAKITVKLAGRSRSQETKLKISAAQTGRIKSVDECTKISDSHKGKVMSVNTKVNMALSHTGKMHSKETKDKISESRKGNASRTGKPHSPETKAKMKEAWIKRKSMGL